MESEGTTISDYQAQKLADRYGPVTSQADVMREQAEQSGGMYKTTLPTAKVLDIANKPAVWAERLGTNTARLEFENIPNEQAMRIVYDILPKVMELYMSKSRDYGGNVMDLVKLGPKASFVDLWRKSGKLKRALWDEQPMVGEQADEILMDLVGHILITLDEMEQQC